jgi:hypothetical protein
MWLRLAFKHKVALLVRRFSSRGYRIHYQRHGVHLILPLDVLY